MHLAKPLGAQHVDPLLGPGLHVDEPDLSQDPQVLRDLRLVEVKPTPDVVHRSRTAAEQLNDSEAIGLCKSRESFDHRCESTVRYICLSRHIRRVSVRWRVGSWPPESFSGGRDSLAGRGASATSRFQQGPGHPGLLGAIGRNGPRRIVSRAAPSRRGSKRDKMRRRDGVRRAAVVTKMERNCSRGRTSAGHFSRRRSPCVRSFVVQP